MSPGRLLGDSRRSDIGKTPLRQIFTGIFEERTQTNGQAGGTWVFHKTSKPCNWERVGLTIGYIFGLHYGYQR